MANSDNLGAVLEPRILAWLRAERIPFLMEVTDAHGGRPQGRPPGVPARGRPARAARDGADARGGPRGAAGPRSQHRYANTNNLWLDLRALDAAMRERDGVLGLPMIRNEKTVDPVGQVLARRLPARDRDGRGDRGLRGRARAARPAHALRAREDDRRPARAALGRLPADRRRARGARARARSRSSRSTPTTSSSCATSRPASRRARRRCRSASASRSRATCASAPASSRAAASRVRQDGDGQRVIEDGAVSTGVSEHRPPRSATSAVMRPIQTTEHRETLPARAVPKPLADGSVTRRARRAARRPPRAARRPRARACRGARRGAAAAGRRPRRAARGDRVSSSSSSSDSRWRKRSSFWPGRRASWETRSRSISRVSTSCNPPRSPNVGCMRSVRCLSSPGVWSPRSSSTASTACSARSMPIASSSRCRYFAARLVWPLVRRV